MVIDSPDLQTLKQRYAFSLITLVFWVLWFYLWLPLISMVAWAFGIQAVYRHMVVLGGFEGLARLIGAYVIAIAVMGVLFIGWALYNYYRFRNRQRRTNIQAVSPEQLAGYFDVSEERLLEATEARRVVFHFTPEGGIDHIETRLLESAPSS